MELQWRFLLSILLITFFHQWPTIGATAVPPPNGKFQDFILKSCNSTLYPDICYTSLSRYAGAIQQSPINLAIVAAGFSGTKLQPVNVYISNLYRSPKLTASLKQCSENFGTAFRQIWKSVELLNHLKSPIDIIAVQTWMRAALTGEDACIDYLKGGAESRVKKDLIRLATEAEKFTSIALALVNLYATTK